MRFPVAVFLVAVCLHAVDAYKILVIFPMPGTSHTILGNGVVNRLAAAGHDITYITPIPLKKPLKNVQQVDVSDNFNHFPNDMLSLEAVINKEVVLDFLNICQLMLGIANATFQNPNVEGLLLDTSQHFDLVIAEWMFSDLYSVFGSIFNAPFIWVSTVDPHWIVLQLLGENANPAYVPDIMTSSIPPFTFWERVQQLGLQAAVHILKLAYIDGFESKVYSSLAPYYTKRGREPPSYKDVVYNASLMFGNSHASMGQALALPQSYKAIGGYHIDSDLPPLPEDLKILLDNAKHGVIYFSMGSNIKSKDMPQALKTSLLKMFGELKQTVFWKFEEVLPGLPKNVHIIKWAPQPSILAHPNCILFITHGGLLSTTETLHFAKPIIGIPVFGDQFINVERAVNKGFAKKVDLSLNMAADLKESIHDIIQDPKYMNKAKELSFIYHDRPVSPGQELVHWAEHVIKTRGAPHLRSPALGVPFYQKLYLDLLALVVAVLFVIRSVIRRIFKKSSRKEKTQ